MLKVIVNSLEMDFDGVISLKMLNPIFNDQVSHSFSIKTYNTPRNKDVIEQLHLPEKRYNQVRFESMLVTDAFTFRGAIYFTSITDKYLDFQFNSQNDFWSIAQQSLKNLTIPFNAEYLPVKNSVFSENFQLTGAYSGFINARDIDGNRVEDGTTAPVPFLKFSEIIAGIFRSLNFEVVKDSLSDHPDVQQLYIYNSNSNVSYIYTPWTGVRSSAADFWEKFQYFYVTLQDGQYNFYNPGGHTVQDGSYVLVSHTFIRPPTVENQLLNHVFKATVTDEYNMTFDIEPAATALGSSNPTAYIMYVALPIYNGVLEEAAANHLPQVNGDVFLKEIEKLVACRIFPDESAKEVRILFLKDILKSNDVIDISEFAGPATEQLVYKRDGFKLAYEEPSEDGIWSEKVKPLTDLLNIKDSVAHRWNLPLTGNINNDVRLVVDENVYYRWVEINFLQNAYWEYYSLNVLDMKTGKEEFKVESKFSPALCYPAVVESTTYSQGSLNITIKAWATIMANIEKVGSYMLLNERSDDLRLFFYRGNVTVQRVTSIFGQPMQYESITVPLCTHDVFNNDGQKIPTANLSLRWDGEYGLYNQLYKEYIDLMVNRYREETRFVNWPAWMLNSFAWWKKYRINSINYLVKSIDLDISPAGIKIKDSVLVPV